ncbi:hypothetical protein DOTSEDRAFT_180559 [Dothistroma septosporum NZE10]|uniref:FAD-binding domain-containing protein n=1 Tax=Dothistroma septosporum (strain NZE10 / CBS 128990) TaxID=675120 RepID=M2WI73_DOTSN|nr:hypothetical protein DOTSEDRAFT_180559 [Dothistroma septosporum NZE10]
MKVIIAGGGIAGLTLANALEKAGIDFILLEARSVIDPQVGASIGLSSASMRVFDQFGAAQAIIDETAPITTMKHHRKDGSLIMPASTAAEILKERFGYCISFLDRQLVLRALAETVESEEKVLPNKRVKSIEHRDANATVYCEDGTSYDGDLVIGCDGVNSKVRSEMWRIAGQTDPTYFTAKERTKMTAEYTCLFGISHPVEGFEQGDLDYTYDKDHSFLIITGKNRRVFWFYFEKLPQVVAWNTKDFPRYSQADAKEHAEKNAWRPCHESRTLGDLWKQRITYTLVPMEEALFDKWSYGRIATIGDSSHKMTANHGQAGNNAVESAVALANQLKHLHDADDTSSGAITAAFKRWQEKRKARIEATVKEAAMICRLQALKTFKDYFTVFWMLPLAADLLLNLSTDITIGAEVMEYLPLPDRAFIGTCAFNPRQGNGFKESILKRALYAAPLLALPYYASQHTTIFSPSDLVGVLVNSGAVDTSSWLYAFSQACDAHLIFAIWLIESTRRINVLTPIQLAPLFVVVAQYFPTGLIAPISYFLYYISNPIDKWAPTDLRLTNVAWTRTIMPRIVCMTASLLTLRLTGYDAGLSATQLRWLTPALSLLLTGVQWLLIKTGISTTDLHHDAKFNVKKDLPSIRACIYVLSTVATISWWTAILRSSSFASTILADSNHIILLLAAALWLALLFKDLKEAGMETFDSLQGVAIAVALAVVGGPASALALLWLRREETLAGRKHKDAVTREMYAGKTPGEVMYGALEGGYGKRYEDVKRIGGVNEQVEING